MLIEKSNIRSDAYIVSVLENLPHEIADSFTDGQLIGLKFASTKQTWRRHPVDFRGTIQLWHSRFYFVFLIGRDLRDPKGSERPVIRSIEVFFLCISFIVITLLGLLTAYLLKSALGINLFSDCSLGIWDWFKALIKNSSQTLNLG